MKYIKLYEQFINEGKADDLINKWIKMDITDPGNEELEIQKFNKSATKYKELWAAFNKATKDMGDNEKGEYASALEILLNESVNEGKYNTVKKVVSKLGKTTSPKDLAIFVKDNFFDVTGTEDMDSGDADDKIADLVGFYKLDPMEWEEAWAEVTESLNESVYLQGAEEFAKELEKSGLLKDSDIKYKVGVGRWARPGEPRFRDHVMLGGVDAQIELYVIPLGSVGMYELYTDKSYDQGRELKKGDAQTILKAMKRYVNKMKKQQAATATDRTSTDYWAGQLN